MRLTEKQYSPLTLDEKRGLHRAAAARGLGAGLLTRALVLHGLDHLDDPELVTRIAEERSATKRRIATGARTAAQQRWGTEGDQQ